MFEGIVSKILVKVLGDYIEDIDSHNLRLRFLSGNVQLKQLKMKPTALDAFDLPITVIWGYVGSINVSIPWKSLGTSPVTLDISDIFIVVQPRKCLRYDVDVERERIEKANVARLHNYELQRVARSLTVHPSSSPSSAAASHGPSQLPPTGEEQEEQESEEKQGEETTKKIGEEQDSVSEEKNSPHPSPVAAEVATTPDDTTTAETTTAKTSDAQTSSDTGGPSFIDRLTETIINNIQIKVKNVRVRYEDDSDPHLPIIFGLNLDHVSVVSCDSNWKETWVQSSSGSSSKKSNDNSDDSTQQFMYKRANITGLSVYSEKTTDFLFSKLNNMDQFKEQMNRFLQQFNRIATHVSSAKKISSLLVPTDATLKVTFQRTTSDIDMTKPKLQLELAPGHVSIKFNDVQYQSLLKTIDYLSNYSKFERYRRLRPEEAYDSAENRMNSKEKRKKWWRYAILAANETLETKYFTWEDVERKKNIRKEYMKLYKRSKASFKRKLEPEEKERLKELERTMSTSDVIFARESAEAQLVIERERYRLHQESLPQKAAHWLTSWFTSSATEKELDQEALDEIEVTDEERRQLEMDIGYNISTSVLLEPPPPDFIEVLFSVILSGQIQLVDSEVDKVIVVGSITDLNVSLGMRSNASSFVVKASVDDINLVDQFTADTQFPDIVTRVDKDQKLMQMLVEINPPHMDQDLITEVSIAGVEITVNIALIQRILGFFLIPSDVNLEELQKILQMTLEEIQRFASLQLQIALQNKYIIALNLQLNAPKFIIPDDVTNRSKPVLTIDLGRLVLHSEPTDKARDERIKQSKLEEKDFYDRYIIELDDASAVLYPSYDEVRDPDTIVSNVSFSLVFSALIVTGSTYPAFTIDSKLPSITLNISPKKVVMLSGIVNNLFDFIDNPVGIQQSMIQKSGYIELVDCRTMLVDAILPPKQLYWCDLRIDGAILLYESENRGKSSVYVAINRHMQVVKSGDGIGYDINSNEFGVVVPTKTSEIFFVFRLTTEHEAHEWCDVIQSKLLDLASSQTVRVIPNQNTISLTDAIQPNQQVVQFRASFTMERLELNVVQTKNMVEVPLLALVISDFDILVQSRKYDNVIDMKLHHIYVNEFTRSSSKLSSLLHSGVEEDEKNIVEARIILSSDERSEYYSQNSDVTVLVDFSELTFHFDPYVMSLLIRKVFEFIDLSELFVSRTLSFVPVLRQTDQLKALDERHFILIQASLALASMILEDQANTFISFSMEKTSISLSVNDKLVAIKGNIGDLTASGHDNSLYHKIMGTVSKEDSLINFEILQDLTPVQSTDPYYPTQVKVLLSSIEFIYVQSVVSQFISYIMDGPLLPTIQEVTTKPSKSSASNPKPEPTNSSAQISLDITLLNPLIVIPESATSTNKLIANLGKITVTNYLSHQRSERNKNDLIWSETIIVELQDTNIQTSLYGEMEKVLKDTKFLINVTRPIIDREMDMPQVSVYVSVKEQFSVQMTHKQYESLFRVIYQNFMAESPIESRRAQLTSILSVMGAKETEDIENEEPDYKPTPVSVLFDVSLTNINLTILTGEESTPIARLDIHDLNVHVNQLTDGATEMLMTLPSVDAFDLRHQNVKQFVESKKSSDETLARLLLDRNPVKNLMRMNLQLGSPEMILDPPLIMDISNYFSTLPDIPQTRPKKKTHGSQFNLMSDIFVASNIFLGEDIDLSVERRLIIARNESLEVTIDGQGHMIDFEPAESQESAIPLIVVESGMTVIFKNVILRYSDEWERLIELTDENCSVRAPTTLNVYSQKLTTAQHVKIKEIEQSKAKERTRAEFMRTVFQGHFGSPRFLIPVSPEKEDSRYFVFEGQMSANIDMRPAVYENIYECSLINFRLSTRSQSMGHHKESASILEPVTISFKLHESITEDDMIRAVSLSFKDSIFARLSYNDVKGILKIVQSLSAKDESGTTSRVQSKSTLDDMVVLSPAEESEMPDQEFRECETEVDHRQILDFTQSELLSSESSQMSIIVPSTIIYTFDITPNLEVSLRLIDDIKGYDVPLLNFSIDQIMFERARVSQLGNDFDMGVTVSFRVVGYFYNMNLALWEPIIEPYHAVMEYERRPTFNPYSSVSYTDKIILKQYESKALKRLTNQTLCVNVSKSMIDTVSKVQQAWTRDIDTEVVSIVLDPVVVKNHCGVEVLFTMQGADYPVRIPTGSEHSFSTESLVVEQLELTPTPVPVTVEIPGIDIGFSLDIKALGIKQFENTRRGYSAMIETTIKEGRRIIMIRSCVKVVNDSSISWTLASQGPNDSQLSVLGEILPNESIGIPILELDNGSLCLKPSDDFDWNNIKNCSWQHFMSSRSRHVLITCPSRNDSAHSYQAIVHSKQAKLDTQDDNSRRYSYELRIEAPMVIENLLGRDVIYSIYQPDAQNILKVEANGRLPVGSREYFYTLDIFAGVFMGVVFDDSWTCAQPAAIYSQNSEHQTKLPIVNRFRETTFIHFDYSSNSSLGAHHRVTLYSPYWLVNYTSKNLILKESSGRILTHAVSHNQESSPMMFSFTREKDCKIALRVDDSSYSDYFRVDNIGVSDYFMVKGNLDTNYCIGFSVMLAPGKFNRTKIVVISSRYMFHNRTPHDVYLKRAHSTEQPIVIQPNKVTDYYWSGQLNTVPELIVSVPSLSDGWSNSFALNSLGDTHIKLRSVDETSIPKILTVNLSEQGGSIIVAIDDQSKPPYIIENQLNTPIQICQHNLQTWWDVNQADKIEYAWDNLMAPQLINVMIGEDQTGAIDINTVTGMDKKFSVRDRDIYLSVRAEHGTRILRVSTHRYFDRSIPFQPAKTDEKGKKKGKKSSKNSRKKKGRSSDLPMSPDAQPERPLEPESLKDEEFSLMVYIDLPSIGFSLIEDTSKREIAFVYMENMSFRFEQTNKNQYIEFMMSKAQIDNQLLDCVYPVVLYSEQVEDKPFIHFSACRTLSDQSAILFRYLSVAMQKMHLRIEYAFLETLITLVSSLLEADLTNEEESTRKMIESFENVGMNSLQDITSSDTKYYFDIFELHPIRIYLSFLFNRTEEFNDDIATKAERKRLLSALTGAGFTMAKIEEAPISASALILKHPFVTQTELIEKIKKHYIRQVTYDFYKILGSLDLIGNPIGLFNDLNTGIKEFFYDPAEALIHRPEDFSSELADGSLKLVTSTIHGTFNTASKLTGTLGKGINFLTFDEEYIRERERSSMMRKPKNVREGFTEGAESLAKNVLQGATGIFTKPVQGAKREGIAGFIKGVGKGIIGIPTKPVSGLVDFATKTNEGISSIGQKQIDRIRYPRTFRKDGAITPYNGYAAFGLYVFSRVDNGRYYREGMERPIVHMTDSNNSTLYVLTGKALYGVSLKDESALWRLPLKTIQSVNKVQDIHGRSTIVVTAPESRKMRQVFSRTGMTSKLIHNFSVSQLERFSNSIVQEISRVKSRDTTYPTIETSS